MAGADPATKPEAVPSSLDEGKNLSLRIVSSAVMAPVAIAVAYVGGWPFVLFWTIAAIGVLYEWMRLVARPVDRHAFLTGVGTIVASAMLMAINRPIIAVLIIALGALGAAVVASIRRPVWLAAGVAYTGLLVSAPLYLREDAGYGFIVMIMLFAIVWATDIVGYFVGRAVGGPKLAPVISPKKTWSGAIAGAVAAIAGAMAVASVFGLQPALPLAILALLLSACSQAGDLLESKIKRMFDAKDAGSLIPGHGGLMDRLDGFWAAAVAAALIGAWRGGLDAPAKGLVVW